MGLARVYLLEAARAMVVLSKEAQGEELRQARRQTAAKLLELARDSDQARTENRSTARQRHARNPPAKPRGRPRPGNGW